MRIDVDAPVAIESSVRDTGWASALALVVAGVGFGFALAYFALRLRPRATSPAAGKRGLGDLTRDELYERAQEAGIQGRSTMSKDELIDALQREA